jgi:23S rRNA (cytidine1920-2'-O)/16S rRNA (cytidine1409-2'-O)-methyltransferase
MTKSRLDRLLVERKLVRTRSQAESYIRLGKVLVAGQKIVKPGHFVSNTTPLKLEQNEQYVSRAGLKLATAAGEWALDFRDKIVLDIGSSTGGFTDFALRRGAKKVVAVDVGTDQLHPLLRQDSRLELHEKTDIRRFCTPISFDIITIDVSFISLREILPYVAQYFARPNTQIVAMVKPQFEGGPGTKNSGVIKNKTERRKILKDFETWAKNSFFIVDKLDNVVKGARGNWERFYLLKITKNSSDKSSNSHKI